MNLVGVAEEARSQFRTAQLRNLYRTDFEAWANDVLGFRTYEKMQNIINESLFGELNRTAIKSSNGVAKDLALDTPILTTEGWKTMGSVQVGDWVFSEEGKPIPVVWKSPIYHKPSFRVTFEGGESFVTSDSHSWNTLDLSARGGGATDWRDEWDRSKTVTTGEIKDTLTRGRTRNHLVPLTKPLQYPEAVLGLHPYVLGAWLGDGTSRSAGITCDYSEDGYVIDRIRDLGYPMRETLPRVFVPELDIESPGRGPRSTLRVAIQEMGLIQNKHIPEQYLRASVEQRIELVRGLMDTDGTLHSGSRVSWGQSDKKLVAQFEELLSGLGVKFSTHSYFPKRGKEAFSVVFRPWFDPFTPGERKSLKFQKQSPLQESRSTGRTIVSVEPVESVPTQCIQVHSERHLYLAGRGLVPTHNSVSVAAMVAWVGSVHEPGEALAIVTAPSLPQIEKITFQWLKTFFGWAEERNHSLPGWVNESLEWKYRGAHGNIDIGYGRKPAAGQEVSVFQGTRSKTGKTFVFIEEAGGVSRELFTAAEAVLTGKDARGIYIGNPDHAGGEWQSIFEDRKYDGEFNRFTISAFDLPTFTGEVVYPDDPEKNAMMMDGLTQVDWVEHKKRIWGERDARYLSKVLGEFPPDSGWGFFPSDIINKSYDSYIEEDLGVPCVFGVDLARMGADESVVYLNRGGRVELIGSWGKQDLFDTTQEIYELAKRYQPTEIRLDATGLGAGVFDFLTKDPQFQGSWDVIGIEGASSAPDVTKWANKRAYIYDSTREQMAAGEIYLDIEDEDLKEQLDLITYRFHKTRGGLVITPKDEMKTVLDGSPDRADAFVYATCDLSPWTGNSLNQLPPGSKVSAPPEQLIEEMGFQMNWLDLGGAF